MASQSALYTLSSQEEGMPQITVLMEVMEGGRLMSPVHRRAAGTSSLSQIQLAYFSRAASSFKKNTADWAACTDSISGESSTALRSGEDTERRFCPFSCLQKDLPQLVLSKLFTGGKCTREQMAVVPVALCVRPLSQQQLAEPQNLLEMQIPRLHPTSTKH